MGGVSPFSDRKAKRFENHDDFFAKEVFAMQIAFANFVSFFSKKTP
jgi:hypothetical protein